MKAIVIQTNQPGQPLAWQETAAPNYGADEVLVDIYTTALNRADLSQRAGHYPPPPGASTILGLEMAGKITAVGAQVSGWRVGDRVCGLLAGGGYAEQINLSQQLLIPMPNHWSYEQAAAMPEVFLTAYVNLFMEANLQVGETVLIHGGAGGVGTAAIQLAREAGCRVFVTVGTADKAARCLELGAELAVNYKEQDFVAAISEHVGSPQAVDVILDMVGADYLPRNLSLLKLRGRIVFIATMGGGKVEIDIRQLMGRRLRLIGSVLRSRSLEEKITIKENFMRQFWPKLVDGVIHPIIDVVYPIEQANEAHQHMADNRNIGKIILRVREG